MPRWRRIRVLRPAEPSAGVNPRAGSPPRLLLLIGSLTLGALSCLGLPAVPDPRWLIVAAIPAGWRWRGRGLWIAFVLGALLAGWHAQTVLDSRWPVSRFGETLTVTGTIITLPQATPDTPEESDPLAAASAASKTWRFVFEPEDPALPQRIRVSWYRSTEILRGGECWRLQLRLRTPHGSLNPGGFDYEGWLFRQGIGATASVRAGESCGRARGHALLRLRQRVSERFAEWLPGHPGLALVSALAIGDTSALDEGDWQAFRLTGTTHLIAISGFNVGIVAGIAFFLLRWLWALVPGLCLRLPAQRAAMLGAALAAFGYALLAGFDPPVARAAFMLSFLMIASGFGGAAQPARALALAWAVIVIAAPLALLTPGLWLSFGAVAAIFAASSGRLVPLPGWRTTLRMQWLLSVVLAPLTLFWFQGTSLLGPLVNLIAVPVVAVLTPAVLTAWLLAAVLPSIGVPSLQLVADALDRSAQALGWLAVQVPEAWVAASPSPGALALALLGSLLLFAPTGLPLRVLGAICVSAVALPVGVSPREGEFELAVLDVGQGLAVVVRTHEHSVLFDAGPAFPGGLDAGRAVVVPYLRAVGIARIDRLIVSHSDLDHRGGVPAVRELTRVDDAIGALTEQPCRSGQRWDWDGVRFEVLNGPATGLSDNDGGCVLKISGAHWRALLPADIEAAGEARLIESGTDLTAEVLVAPHHGSRTSSGADFIAAVQPKIVVYSAGWHHRFGHPAPEIVRRYTAFDPGLAQWSTGDSGAILIEERDGKPVLRTWRAQAGRLWNTPGDERWRDADERGATRASSR